MELGKEYFGPLWKYIANEEITDVDYNGREIWLTNIYNERYRVNQAYVDENMTLAFVEQFTQRIANVVSQQFNKQNPELEAEQKMDRWMKEKKTLVLFRILIFGILILTMAREV